MFRRLTLRPFSGRAQNRGKCVSVSRSLRPKVRNAICYRNTLLNMNINRNHMIDLYRTFYLYTGVIVRVVCVAAKLRLSCQRNVRAG